MSGVVAELCSFPPWQIKTGDASVICGLIFRGKEVKHTTSIVVVASTQIKEFIVHLKLA